MKNSDNVIFLIQCYFFDPMRINPFFSEGWGPGRGQGERRGSSICICIDEKVPT